MEALSPDEIARPPPIVLERRWPDRRLRGGGRARRHAASSSIRGDAARARGARRRRARARERRGGLRPRHGLRLASRHRIPVDEIGRFSFATVADQTGMYGRPLATDVVRAMMLARANGMAKAGVGVRRELVELLVALLNAGVHPIVRMSRLGRAGRPLGDVGHRQGA